MSLVRWDMKSFPQVLGLVRLVSCVCLEDLQQKVNLNSMLCSKPEFEA